MAQRVRLLAAGAAQLAPSVLFGGLVCVMAFQAAALAWAVLAPIGPFGRAQAAQASAAAPSFDWAVFSRFDPFFRTLGPSGPVIAQSGVDLGLTLFAIRRDARGEGGSAIVATADGRQIAVRVGEEVSPGLKLHGIQADGAVFQRGAALLELKFPAAANGAVSVLRPAEPTPPLSSAPAAANAGQVYQVDPRSFFTQVRLTPLRDGERLVGYKVGPESSQQPLSNAGLRRGDVLLSVNGVSLSTAAALQAAANSLAGRSEAVITYERQGKSGSVTVRVAKP